MTWGGPMKRGNEIIGGDGAKAEQKFGGVGKNSFWQCSCGRSFDVEQWCFDHMSQAHQPVTQAAQLSQLKADFEAALERARLEGRLDALDEAAQYAEQVADQYASTWGENSAGDKALRKIMMWASGKVEEEDPY